MNVEPLLAVCREIMARTVWSSATTEFRPREGMPGIVGFIRIKPEPDFSKSRVPAQLMIPVTNTSTEGMIASELLRLLEKPLPMMIEKPPAAAD